MYNLGRTGQGNIKGTLLKISTSSLRQPWPCCSTIKHPKGVRTINAWVLLLIANIGRNYSVFKCGCPAHLDMIWWVKRNQVDLLLNTPSASHPEYQFFWQPLVLLIGSFCSVSHHMGRGHTICFLNERICMAINFQRINSNPWCFGNKLLPLRPQFQESERSLSK